MKTRRLVCFVFLIGIVIGSLLTLGSLAFIAPKIKYKYLDFNQIEGDVAFKNFSLKEELDPSTGAHFLRIERKGVCFGVLGINNTTGLESIVLTDPNNRMTFLMSFSDNHINKIDLGYSSKPRTGAIYNNNDSNWEWAWRYESDPNGGQVFFVDIDWDGLDDIKRVISSTGEETGQFIFCEKDWLRVNEYRESDDGQARAEDDENKYVFDKTSGVWCIEKSDPNR